MTMTPEKFRDLIEAATSPAPPSPSPRTELKAGRRRLRRRRGAAGAALTVAAALVLAGSLVGGSPRAADQRQVATDPSSPTTSGSVHAQVLSDVVDAAFPTPGRAALRNIRVRTFLRSWGVERCGGTGAPADSTADRYEQDVLPNLELIREKGFSEPSSESFDGARDDCQIGEELQAAAPAFEEWFALAGPWHELVRATLKDPGLAALRTPMAECLRAATGLSVSDQDPAGSFLGAIDGAGSDGSVLHREAVAYADCGVPYFGKLEQLLLEQRPAYVEQHRQLLGRFAGQVAALGYTP